jgi:hypothetical protein
MQKRKVFFRRYAKSKKHVAYAFRYDSPILVTSISSIAVRTPSPIFDIQSSRGSNNSTVWSRCSTRLKKTSGCEGSRRASCCEWCMCLISSMGIVVTARFGRCFWLRPGTMHRRCPVFLMRLLSGTSCCLDLGGMCCCGCC